MNTLYVMYMPAHTAEEITGLSTYPTMVMAFGKSCGNYDLSVNCIV